MTYDILDGIGGAVIAHREPVEGEFFRVYRDAEKKRFHDQQKHAPVVVAPPRVTVIGRDLFRKYHTQEEAEAFRRAIKMADDLADGDKDGSLDDMPSDALKALEVIGQWYYFEYHPDKLFGMDEVQPILDAAIKLGVYGDKPPEPGKLPEMKEARAVADDKVIEAVAK